MIREYRVGDLDRMFQLDEICFEAPFQFDRESVRMFAEAKTAIALVAEDDGGEIAGFLIVHVEGAGGGRRGYVVTLDVAPTCRRAGLAGRMMDKAERQVGLVGGRWMELHVFVENEGAVRFYEGRGYERMGRRQGFYDAGNVGLDAFVYRKNLN